MVEQFETDNDKIIKKIAGYHQFHAVRAAVAATVKAKQYDASLPMLIDNPPNRPHQTRKRKSGGCLAHPRKREKHFDGVFRQSAAVDWQKRDSVRARMRNLVRRLLRRWKYPPDMAEEAIKLVLEQAEALADGWHN